MKPTRLTQPYRKGARPAGRALDAMKQGRAMGGLNLMDAYRQASKRKTRPTRPPRPARRLR